ncbi:hypothetical protein ALC53_01753, partial [Atta colombica]
KQKSDVDYVYGVYLHKDGLMFGNKRFDMDDANNIIIDSVRYVDTSGLYELIFKRIPDDLLYMEDDMNKYKSMLLASIAGPIIEQQGELHAPARRNFPRRRVIVRGYDLWQTDIVEMRPYSSFNRGHRRYVEQVRMDHTTQEQGWIRNS